MPARGLIPFLTSGYSTPTLRARRFVHTQESTFYNLSVALQADPSGDYIRYFVPELSKVYGDGAWLQHRIKFFRYSGLPCSDIHNPSAKLAEKLGYPLPLVKHDEARLRAIRRYKNPGDD